LLLIKTLEQRRIFYYIAKLLILEIGSEIFPFMTDFLGCTVVAVQPFLHFKYGF